MRTSILILLFISAINFLCAQYTTIPDSNFEQALIDLGYDDLLDGQVLNSNISAVESLVIQDYEIINLAGIEGFTALVSLNLYMNQITVLDFSQNVLLQDLNCSANPLLALNITQNTALTTLNSVGGQLSSLDLSQNPNLEYVYCPMNFLTSLDLSQNPLLHFLGCQENQITSLDLSNNPLLTTVYCHSNNLSCLNIDNGNNEGIFNFSASYNPDLLCVEVEDEVTASLEWDRFIDKTCSFSENCNNDCSTGLDEIEGSFSNLKIFPIPTSGNIYIELGENVQNLKATLINNLGKVIYIEEFHSTDKIQLEIDAPAGIYFLRLESEKGNMRTLKILKK